MVGNACGMVGRSSSSASNAPPRPNKMGRPDGGAVASSGPDHWRRGGVVLLPRYWGRGGLRGRWAILPLPRPPPQGRRALPGRPRALGDGGADPLRPRRRLLKDCSGRIPSPRPCHRMPLPAEITARGEIMEAARRPAQTDRADVAAAVREDGRGGTRRRGNCPAGARRAMPTKNRKAAPPAKLVRVCCSRPWDQHHADGCQQRRHQERADARQGAQTFRQGTADRPGVILERQADQDSGATPKRPMPHRSCAKRSLLRGGRGGPVDSRDGRGCRAARLVRRRFDCHTFVPSAL